MSLLLPKAKRPKFSVVLKIYDLTNIPLVSGHIFVRWHIKDSPRGDCRGRTDKVLIRDHKAVWNYTQEIEKVRMVIDRDGMLEGKHAVFEVVSEHMGEKVELGSLVIDLAEYAKENGMPRRYLLQHSKINSTIKISLLIKQLSGDTTFSTPPLSSGQIFGGITGVLGEQQANDALLINQTTPSLYRKTLTATWIRQDGELAPEECVEDIFSGGDGWARDSDGVSKGGVKLAGLTDDRLGGLVPNVGVDIKKRNGEILGWAAREDLRSWRFAGRPSAGAGAVTY